MMPKKVIHFANSTVILFAVLIMVGLFSLSAVFAASGSTVLAPQVDVEATAHAIQFRNHRAALEAASKARMAIIQTEIQEVQQSINSLDNLIQTRTAQHTNQRLQLQEQIEQEQASIQQLEASVIQLQQQIQAAQARSSQNLITLEDQLSTVKLEFQQRLEAVSLELASLETKLDLQTVTTSSTDNHDGPVSEPDDDNELSDDSSEDDSDHSDDENEKGDDDTDRSDQKDDKAKDEGDEKDKD